MLHILTKGPNSSAAEQMLQMMGQEDVVMLIEEGVTAALNPEWKGWKCYAACIFVLTEDTHARGLENIVEANNFPMLKMDEFVVLTEQHEQIVTWY